MPFISNASPAWIEELYRKWLESPDELPADWRSFFSGYELGLSAPPVHAPALDDQLPTKQSGIQSLIYRYRDIGHLLACTDPLTPCRIDHPLLSLETFGLSAADLQSSFHIGRFYRSEATLDEVVQVMRDTYCRSIGVEFMHIQEPRERQWLIDRMEPVRNSPVMPPDQQLSLLVQLQETVQFDNYLNRKFPGQTRFSLNGGEVLIPMLTEVLSGGLTSGVHDVVMGMPHRGRMNVLANVLEQPLEGVFALFRDNREDGIVGDGDVKYHAGYSTEFHRNGTSLHVTLSANPSHLEAIDPVVEGKARARLDRCRHSRKGCVLPLLIHGDAAFAGQGVVAETFNLSQLPGFCTEGTLHIVVNNQIGFTTLPQDARSSCYATDAAKIVGAPVFHVHGEDPEAAIHAVRLALDYRQTFLRDVVVEIVCYRRFGHNEGDEPSFTQPVMYRKIDSRPSVAELYRDRLQEQGRDLSRAATAAAEHAAALDAAFDRHPPPPDAGFSGEWTDIERDFSSIPVETHVPEERLVALARRLGELPEDFNPHPKIAGLLKKRLAAVESGQGIDWALAEELALATLLDEGVSVRLSGQDVRRGSFNQRHAVLSDTASGRPFSRLDHVAAEGAAFSIFDSMLSEYAVLGFEYGYSLATPQALTIWEAQYGDFANGAQVIIDQFIASGETKWQRVSGLVMLLPHGYEGQGPEHSSGRIERFLQLCADDNMLVAYPSTPVQLFHLLRRQVRSPYRKPLVAFTPKSLLRRPECVSNLEEFATGRFSEILTDGTAPGKLLLLCSGKVYYDLLERKKRDKRNDVTLWRIEQLYPLRRDLLDEYLSHHKQGAEIRWVQEEPVNMGAWPFMEPHLRAILGRDPVVVARRSDSSPAIGSYRQHKVEQEHLVDQAFAERR